MMTGFGHMIPFGVFLHMMIQAVNAHLRLYSQLLRKL